MPTASFVTWCRLGGKATNSHSKLLLLTKNSHYEISNVGEVRDLNDRKDGDRSVL